MHFPFHKRQRKPVRSCLLRCQQGFVLSLIAIGVTIFILIVVTPLPLMIEDFVSNVTPSFSLDVKMLNLVEDGKATVNLNHTQCTLDYVNKHKLQQDHPCVIHMIREYYQNPGVFTAVHNVSDVNNPLHNSTDDSPDVAIFCRIFKKKLFLECRTLNDRSAFNNLLMDQILQWRGMQITRELLPHSSSSSSLELPFCLSFKPYPTEMFIDAEFDLVAIDKKTHRLHNRPTSNSSAVKAQCFPLYSILMAFERNELDYFSLDAGGKDLEVLRTLPFHLVDIKTLVVEQDHIRQKESSLTDFMTENGYLNLGYVVQPESDRARLKVFIQDFLRNWRPNYVESKIA